MYGGRVLGGRYSLETRLGPTAEPTVQVQALLNACRNPPRRRRR
ncbi:hypothetical protein SMC26_00820 [Actinomadura fulvescens]